MKKETWPKKKNKRIKNGNTILKNLVIKKKHYKKEKW